VDVGRGYTGGRRTGFRTLGMVSYYRAVGTSEGGHVGPGWMSWAAHHHRTLPLHTGHTAHTPTTYYYHRTTAAALRRMLARLLPPAPRTTTTCSHALHHHLLPYLFVVHLLRSRTRAALLPLPACGTTGTGPGGGTDATRAHSPLLTLLRTRFTYYHFGDLACYGRRDLVTGCSTLERGRALRDGNSAFGSHARHL